MIAALVRATSRTGCAVPMAYLLRGSMTGVVGFNDLEEVDNLQFYYYSALSTPVKYHCTYLSDFHIVQG